VIGRVTAIDEQERNMMSSNATQSGYAEVNGITLYYEIHGTGQPLVLLHGGLGAIEMFGTVLHALAATHQVIGIDLQAHGRTADIDRPLRYETMADDVAALIAQLGFDRAAVMGYSLGGGVALQTAIQHPELVEKLVVVSAPYRRDGWYSEVLAGMNQMGAHAAESMKQTPMYQTYASLAPRIEDWPILLTKTGDLLRQDYDWSAEVVALAMPTLLVIGDADSVSPAHAAAFFGLLGGGKGDAGWDHAGMTPHRLAILPATTHFNSFSTPALPPVVVAFLDSPLPART